jgi:hypothetical protein
MGPVVKRAKKLEMQWPALNRQKSVQNHRDQPKQILLFTISLILSSKMTGCDPQELPASTSQHLLEVIECAVDMRVNPGPLNLTSSGFAAVTVRQADA